MGVLFDLAGVVAVVAVVFRASLPPSAGSVEASQPVTQAAEFAAFAPTIPNIIAAASRVPYYSVHGIGVQANYILSAKNFALFFKDYDEYSAKARVEGRTIVFGGSWTLKIPKSQTTP
jgi:hypothetical protein